jgi:hypothetical protein
MSQKKRKAPAKSADVVSTVLNAMADEYLTVVLEGFAATNNLARELRAVLELGAHVTKAEHARIRPVIRDALIEFAKLDTLLEI